jgi:hypothetical protein
MSAIESNIQSSSAAGGGPGPNLGLELSKNGFNKNDIVWVQDENNRNWFPGQITEKKADNLYDIQFNQDPHPGVPMDQITKFDLKVGDDVIILNDNEERFSNDNFKNGKISGINDENRYNLDKDKYDVIYDDNTKEENILLTNLAETDAQMLSNLAGKNKEDIDIGNSVLTTVDIFGKGNNDDQSVYGIINNLFLTNKLNPKNHKYKFTDIFDISKFNDLDFVLTGLFNNNTQNPPLKPSAIEINAKNITFLDISTWLCVPEKNIGADTAFIQNNNQIGIDLSRNHIMTIMNGKNTINTSSKYIVPGSLDADKNFKDYKKFLTDELNKDTSFFNDIERRNYINFLFYIVGQTLLADINIVKISGKGCVFYDGSPETKIFFYDINKKIVTYNGKYDLVMLPSDGMGKNNIGNMTVNVIIDLKNISQSIIRLIPFLTDEYIQKGDYLFPPTIDIDFDGNTLKESKIIFTPPTSAEQIFPQNLVTIMIDKINKEPIPKNDCSFQGGWFKEQLGEKINETIQEKLSLSLSNILSLQSSVRCLTEEKDNIYLLNYSTLNALVGIKENYTTLDLNTLWSALDRDIHGVSIYFNEIKYNLHNKEMVNADEELTSLTDFIMSNYKDVNGDNIHPNSLCQILLLISQGVGNAITEGLGVLLQNDNVTFVTITNNLLGNNVKKQFGITGNSIVIRSTKAKGEIGKSNRYIIGNRLNLINTFYFLLYNDGDPFAIVEIKINIDIQKDKFSVEYKTIGFFKYYDLMKTFYFGKFDNKQFPPAPNGSGSLSVYEQDKLEPVFTIQSDEWTNGILAKGAQIVITDNRGTMVGGTKGGTSIQVGGGNPYRTVLTTDLDPNTFKNEDFMDFIDSEIENYKLKLTNITQERDDVKAVENAVKTENYLRSDNRIGGKSHQGIVLFDTDPSSNASYYVYIGPILPNGDKTVSISKKYGKILRFSKEPNVNVSDKKYTVFIKPGKENSSDWDKFVLKPNFSKNYSNTEDLPLKWSIARFGSVFDNFKFSLSNNSLGQNGIASELVTRVFRDLMVDPIANDLSLTKGLFEDTQRVFKMEKMIYIQVLIYFKILFVLLKRYDSNLISLPGYVSIKPLLNKLYEDYDSFTQFNEEVSDDYKYTAATDSATAENTGTSETATDNIDEELNSAPVSTLLSPIISSMDTKTNASVFEPINQNIDDPALLREYVLKAALLVLQNLGIVLQMYMNILGRMPVDEDSNMVANYNPFALYPMYQKLVNVYSRLYQFYMDLKNNNDVEISDTLTKHNSATINKYLVSLALRIGTSSSLMTYGGYMSRKNKHKSYKRKFSKRISKNSRTKATTKRNHNYSKIEREREQRYTRKL